MHGYCVTRDGSRTVIVLNSMAHAYPEAYLKGLGWVVLEPTPGFAAGAAWDEKGISLEGFADAFEKILYSSEHLTEEDIGGLGEEYELIKGSLEGKDKIVYMFLNFMGLG